MADFTDRVRIVYDVVADGATSGFGKIKSSVADAEGATGKLKAAAGGAADFLASSVPLAAGAAAAAIGKMALDGVNQFDDLAKAADTFATATGSSVEQASRWLEVSDDLGVSADAVQGAMGRLNREAEAGKLAKYGIDASDANGRLLQLVDLLAGTEDGAKRAAIGFDTLGKGWQSIVPLIAHASELRDRLQDVSDQKVITPGEVADARKYDEALNDLKDSTEDLQISLGQKLVPVLAGVAEGFANAAKGAGLLDSSMEKASANDSFWGQVWHNLTRDLGYLTGGTQQHDAAARKQKEAVDEATAAAAAQSAQLALNNALLTDTSTNTTAMATALAGMGLNAQSAADDVDSLNASVDELAGKFLDNAGAALQALAQYKAISAQLQSGKGDVTAIEQSFISYAKTLENQGGTPAAIEGLSRLKGLVQPGSELDTYLTNLINGLQTIDSTDATANVSAPGAAETGEQLAYIKTVLDQIDGYDAEARIAFVTQYEGPSIPAGLGVPRLPGQRAVPAAAPAALGAPVGAMTPSVMAAAGATIVNISLAGGTFLASRAEAGRWISDALDAFYRTSGTRRRP